MAQLEAQYSNDKYQLVTAEANRDQLKLELKQLLELDINQEMNLATPEIDESKVLVPLPDKSTVYTTALGFVPSIQSGKLELEVAELNIANAKAGYYPNLSLNAGIGSGHNTGNNGSFGTQMKQGFNESVGLTLSVPIYSRRSNKSAVERAKIQQKISQLDLKNRKRMARCFVRPIEIPCGKRTAQRHKDLLRTHRRTVLPRYEKYGRDAHGEKQLAVGSTRSTAIPFHGFAQFETTRLLRKQTSYPRLTQTRI